MDFCLFNFLRNGIAKARAIAFNRAKHLPSFCSWQNLPEQNSRRLKIYRTCDLALIQTLKQEIEGMELQKVVSGSNLIVVSSNEDCQELLQSLEKGKHCNSEMPLQTTMLNDL